MVQHALSTILTELRVSGSIVLSQAHPVPWSIQVPKGSDLRNYLGVGDDVTVVPFHIAHAVTLISRQSKVNRWLWMPINL